MVLTRLFLLLCLVSTGHAQVVISEFMAANVNTTIVDEDGSHQDWLELQNNGASAASLNGWYLTDDATDLRKWRFPLTAPAVSLAPGARLLVWCSNKNRKANATKLHTNFRLDSAGEYLGLVQPDGLTVQSKYDTTTQPDGKKTYPPQATDIAYGISGGKAWNVLSGPTLNSLWRVRVPQDAPEFTTTIAGWNTNTAFVDAGWTQKMVTVIGGIPKGLGYDAGGSGGTRGYLVNYTASPTGVLTANTDVGATTYGMYSTPFPAGAPTLCARTTFNVVDKTTIQSLRLNIKYDDGFIVYLNGTEILRNNAPATPAFNSTAADREDDRCEEFEAFPLAGAQATLVNGTNLLAIHGFNSARNAAQFILNPSLEAYQTVVGAPSGAVGYLTSATPGTENTTASTVIGPDISQTTKNPIQPAASTSAPFTITARVRATLGPIASVQLRTVRMFDQAYGSEPALTMLDNATGGDAIAGDGIYTAQIPASFMATLAASQMLRWRVVATDSAANVSNDPPYRDPYDNDQYFGTVAQAGSIQSLLPVMFWFHNSSATTAVFATTEGGFRSAFFYKLPTETSGRFYDNIHVTLHGQSTAGFGKKSQNINFNTDNKFKWREGEDEIGGMNLLSNWADKSHTRNPLAWELWNRTRHPSHFCQTVRLQQITATATPGQGNVALGVDTQFLCLIDMVEDGNQDFLKRWGLDGDGALYKCYNSLTDTSQNSSTNGAGVEKKTREWEDFSDLAALVTAMNSATKTVTQRRQWLYDNVDVPGLINYVAVHNLIHSHDYGHKNYYIYRDTLRTGEWTLLPWDQDLSFGHRWTSAQNYFDDDIESASTIFSGGGGNYVMNILLTSGATELTQMYVRRLRTLADQYYGPTAAPVNYFANRMDATLDQIDPPGWPVMTDAERDFQKWGFWVDGSGGAIGYTDPRAADHRIRATAVRIKSANNTVVTGGPYPGANPYAAYGAVTNLHSSVNAFIPGRRAFLYNEIAGATPSANGQTIPTAQPAAPVLVIESVNFNPGGTDQDGEYFILRNTTAAAVDISNWRLGGQVGYDFKAGTVIPAAGTATSDGTSAGYVNQLIIAKKNQVFRARATSPKAAEYRLVVGGYNGQLSARGGAIFLSRPDDPINLAATTYTQVATTSYTGAPTSAQTNLRITELNYHPADPSAAELLALPGVGSGDFEFIELINNGPAAHSLAGAQFQRGVEFTFPAATTLAAGARCLLVANLAAFRARYGTSLDTLIPGEFLGNLDNAGEQIQLTDSVGEVVLDFTYSDTWYPPTDGTGRSLVTRVQNTAHTAFDTATAWAISGAIGGTPGTPDASTAQVFEGWRNNYFTTAEFPTTAALLWDADSDGLDNFTEYAFGRAPKTADNSALSTGGNVTVANKNYLSVTFTRPKNALDVTYSIEASSDLASWSEVNAPVSTTDLGDGREQVTFRDTTHMGTIPRFIRVRAAKP